MRKRFINTLQSLVLTGLLVVISASCAAAQDNSYAHMLNVTMTASQSLFVAQTAVNKQREVMRVAAGQPPHAYGGGQQPQYGGGQQPQAPVIQYPITATDFQPLSPPIMPEQFANAATGVDAATRASMRNLFQQVLTAFETKARKDNFANAFAFICAAALQVRNGKEPTNAEVDQMIASFNNRLAGSPTYYTFNPRQQQMLYESLIITGGIIVFLDVQGKQTNNVQLQAQAREMSDAVLKSFLGI